MTLPRARLFGPSRFLFAAFSAAFIWISSSLTGCSNTPDQTGLAYLQSQNIQLSTPLYHFVFTNVPVDSVFPTELPLNHFGESLMVVGRDGPFTAAVRMGFQITTQPQRDSILKGLSLRLVALPPVVTGYSFLQSSTANHDSLTLLIKSFAWNDTIGTYADSLPVYHARILANFNNSFSQLNSKYIVFDTARIAIKGAYATGVYDSLQVCALNNLRARMNADTVHNWQVWLEISPLYKTGAAIQDSGMFRFVGENGTYYDPGLLLGSYVKGVTNTSLTPPLLIPYTSLGLPGVNYQVTHSGDANKLLYGVSRGVNLRLNRDSLLNLIKDSLGTRNPSLIPKYFSSATGKYDSRFFVPYAVVHIPVADSLARVDGPFSLDMQMVSDVDSLDPGSTMGLIPVSVDDSLTLYPMQMAAPTYTGQLQDTLICGYHRLLAPADTNLREVTLRWIKDLNVTDTFIVVADGKRHEVGLKRHNGWLRPATLGFYPNPSNVQVEVYFNIGSGVEANGFLDPVTRGALTDAKSLSSRFWHPGAKEIDLRATNGIGTLLNRASGVISDLLVKPNDHNAFDTAVVADTTEYLQVSYPVMGEIGFPRTNGKLHVTVDVYIYPLSSDR